MTDVQILDCTIRDGSYSVDFKFTKDEIYNIVNGLATANVKYIEVGHGLGLGAYKINGKESLVNDRETIQVAKDARANTLSKIGVFCIPGISTLNDIKDAKEEGIDFIRVGINTTNYKEAIPYLEYAQKENLEVSLNFMKSYTVNKLKFLHHAKEIDKIGIDYIYVVDSAGGMLPGDVGLTIKLLKDNIDSKIGFHGHNNLMLANANNIEAIKNGANIIDTTIMGIGRGGGNSSTEVMLHILDRMGIDLNIDKKLIFDIAKKYINNRISHTQISDIDIISGFSYFHSGFLNIFENVSNELDIDLRDLIIEVSKIDKSSPDMKLIREIGLKLTKNSKNVYMSRNVKEF